MAVPFITLTGYLGAGKTTILNRMLASPGARRIAVLVNELGRISIDTKRIVHDGGDVLELSGGCVCCKIDVKSDLVGGIGDVVERSKPDYVVLETTGIADPGVLLDRLHALKAEGALPIEPVSTICVVGADNASAAVARFPEAESQVQLADGILISKTDLASETELAATHAMLDSFNPDAERASFPAREDGDALLTEWLLSKRQRKERPRRRKHEHIHAQLSAVSFVEDSPLVPALVEERLASLGSRLVRAKGTFRDGEGRGVRLDYAGKRFHREIVEVPSRCELVVIGEGLDAPTVHRLLWTTRFLGGSGGTTG